MATVKRNVNPNPSTGAHQQSFVLRATRDEAAAAWRYVVKSVDDPLPYLFDDLHAAFQYIEATLSEHPND